MFSSVTDGAANERAVEQLRANLAEQEQVMSMQDELIKSKEDEHATLSDKYAKLMDKYNDQLKVGVRVAA